MPRKKTLQEEIEEAVRAAQRAQRVSRRPDRSRVHLGAILGENECRNLRPWARDRVLAER